jgi:peptidoglycan hydrolase-like protein with peptidoglycan-binding domain
MGDTGPTGFQGFQGPTASPEYILGIMGMFPSAATGIVEPPHIATLDELMASHAAVVTKEAEDKQTMSDLITRPRDILRPSLFEWAAAGLPDGYIIQSFTLVPPTVCSDGVTRDAFTYINYCLGMNVSDVISKIESKVIGVKFSYSINGNTLRIHVNKA